MHPLSSSSKPLPQLPAATRNSPLPLDNDSKTLLWKLLHNWLRHAQLQAKWTSVIYDLLARILQAHVPETSSLSNPNPEEMAATTSPLSICIQLFETGTPTQSTYLSSSSHGIQLETLTDLPLPSVYGGTIRLYGAPKSLQQKLTDIMSACLYTLYSLQLETKLMQDHHVQQLTKLSRQDKQLPLIETSAPNDKTWKSGLLGRIWKKQSTRTGGNTTKTVNSSTSRRRQSMFGSKNLTRKPVAIETVNDISPTANTSTAYYDSPMSHHYKNLRLGLQMAILSTSPSCGFTAPPIISVLEKEEDNLNTIKTMISTDQQQQQRLEIVRQKQRSGGHHIRTKLASLARRSSSSASLGPTPEQRIIIMLPQSIMAYSLLRIPRHILDDTNKIGMDYLYLDTASIKAFTHHQHLTVNYSSHLIGCPDRPCIGPTLCTIQYFRYDTSFPYSDQKLGLVLKRWLDQCDQSCKQRNTERLLACNNNTDSSQPVDQYRQVEALDQQPKGLDSVAPTFKPQQQPINTEKIPLHGCNQPLQDHVLCFCHGLSRIGIYFISRTPTSDHLGKITFGNSDTIKDDLICWTACTICDARTPSQRISQATFDYSFAKYLELCLYSTRFTGLKTDICQHAKTNPSAIARCFGLITTTKSNTIEIRFVKEDINVYRLKGSPLQIVQSSDSAATANPRISNSTMERWKLKEKWAIDDFFKLIRQHLTWLESQWLNGESDTDITFWRTHLDMDQQHLTSALKDACNGVDGITLNDFRRFFTMKVSMVMNSLGNWQCQRWPKEDSPLLLTWDGWPDYMNTNVNKTIHCFPGSAIMVRELEPTSIVAYTLSSNEYAEEMGYSQPPIGDSDPLPVLPPTPPSKTVTSSTLSAKTDGDESNHSINHHSHGDHVIDSYYSSVERKYIAPSTGADTETASFRTMVMETVKNNVSELEQHAPGLTQMKQLWRTTTSDKIQKIEQDLNQSIKEIKEFAVYQDPIQHTALNGDALPRVSPTTSPQIAPAEAASTKIRFIHGNKEFTCIVYYASEFELLRRSCGVDQLIIESLGRCQTWEMTGGKSKSRFYKTQDNRLVVKEMMTAWNIAEKDAFLRFAPKYFDYIKKSDKAPTVLAKIFGFYSIQMRGLDDKKQIFNMDVLVMENLFYGQSIIKTFDFKGIPERQVEKERKSKQEATLWDGDWKNGNTLLLICNNKGSLNVDIMVVYPLAYRMDNLTCKQSREWINSAIQRDTEFLASGNIMDYSLLIGIDETKKEISVGIVDYIGAYTWYKKIESRSKSTIHRNREVTILPPDQYRIRFCREVLEYFIPIPDSYF
ncbi:hypothetical protein BC941DRAFT_475162 [Chlamydoabsidia padenii]|nr:hypothetical protein BC941DRAFT_475162 [Chlamydoabsidia padenii]